MGLKMNERYVILTGILFLATVSFLSLFLLPATATDELISGEHIVPHVRDVEIRKVVHEHDVAELRRKAEEAGIVAPPIPKPEVAAADDSDARKVTVKQMTKFAWDNYRKYAWGANELRPVSKGGHSASVFGAGDIGATIVDAIDTLWIMGLKEEYEQARSWIQHSLDFSRAARGDLSVFETNIRFVGGLLSIYALTNDKMYVEKAEAIAKLLLPAFDTPTGIPYALVNPTTGTISVKKIRNFLTELEKPNGLYPLYLNPRTGKWGSLDHSIGALGDSFYEYLLKHWVITGKKDKLTKDEYDAAVFAMEKKMLYESQPNKLWYFANLRGSRVEHKMEHLACFSGGMFALHSANEENDTAHYLDLAEKLAHTCHESYARSAIGIGPEAFRFTKDIEAKAVSINEKYYILRPEVVETWFYLWRITKQDKYREWAWNVVLALEKYAKVEAGYSGIRDVYSVPVEHDDVQQSFLFAELFKYLYLIFADDNVLPLNKWVFNTEAHPLPIRDQ
ncbi:glycosyl hydrolase family 47 [Necator americanus]|uniref:alpha-1,2-Mannosidase n=1 Tax=Necator americanus TaxID=51031 RepID=W2SGW8_NECAM|nr:glycosyl hydrolase family 47 [Necator americanus]ETN68835.1 glycosyl hydrolase family 47 [Necator americanus]